MVSPGRLRFLSASGSLVALNWWPFHPLGFRPCVSPISRLLVGSRGSTYTRAARVTAGSAHAYGKEDRPGEEEGPAPSSQVFDLRTDESADFDSSCNVRGTIGQRRSREPTFPATYPCCALTFAGDSSLPGSLAVPAAAKTGLAMVDIDVIPGTVRSLCPPCPSPHSSHPPGRGTQLCPGPGWPSCGNPRKHDHDHLRPAWSSGVSY